MSAISIVTPEGTELSFELAHPMERALAYLLDLVIVVVIYTVILLVGLFLSFAAELEPVLALTLFGLFALWHGYFLFFEIRFQGATPAKRALGLRVLSRDGGQLTIESIVARNVMRDLEVLIPLAAVLQPQAVTGRAPWWLAYPAVAFLLLIALLPLLTKDRTRSGDLVAGTVVVKVPAAALLKDEAKGSRSAKLRFTPEQLSVYGELELETLADLLRSHDDGRAEPEALREVARTIAGRIRFDGNEPAAEPLLFLRAFYRDQRSALERELLMGRRIANKHERGPPKVPTSQLESSSDPRSEASTERYRRQP